MRAVHRVPAVSACLLSAAAIASFGSPAWGAAYVVSTTQACYGNAAGDCETAPPILVPGESSDISRFYGGSDGYSFQASATSTTGFASFGLFARASGSVNPLGGGPTFLNNDTRIGRAFGTLSDQITAGAGGGSGFLRIPLQVTGSTIAEWQNGASYVQLGLTCSSNLPGSPTTLGPCNGAARNITTSGPIDETFELDLPIVLGQPVQFMIQMTLSAGTGYGYGNLVPFTGQAEGSAAGEPSGATVLDAAKSPIPDAPISLGESGFDYQNAPEASSWATAVAALAALASLRGRCRRGERRRARLERARGLDADGAVAFVATVPGSATRFLFVGTGPGDSLGDYEQVTGLQGQGSVAVDGVGALRAGVAALDATVQGQRGV